MSKRRILQLLVALFIVLGTSGYTWWQKQQPVNFRVVALDIGQGDAEFIQFRNGEKMLVDCGPNKKILERLGAQLSFYDRTIDYLLVTHPHLDHYGGCIEVLKRYNVKYIMYNTTGSEKDPYWLTWNEAIGHSGAEVIRINHKDQWEIASTTLQFLAPDPDLDFNPRPSDVNDTSIVFRLLDEPTGQSILFTGDMEEPLEKALLTHYCLSSNEENTTALCPELQAHILKAGHHGSDTSSSQDFLDAVNPEKVVISAGKNNKFHHPSLPTLKRLKKRGVTILRTDEKGDILME